VLSDSFREMAASAFSEFRIDSICIVSLPNRVDQTFVSMLMASRDDTLPNAFVAALKRIPLVFESVPNEIYTLSSGLPMHSRENENGEFVVRGS